MRHLFTLPNAVKEQNVVILDRYKFINGEMIINDDFTAGKAEKILCRYYGVIRTAMNESKADDIAPISSSLAKDTTQKSAPAATKAK